MVQVDRAHYDFLRYVSKPRWASYYYQLRELASLEPSNALEVGIGPGIFCSLARALGHDVTTVDFDPELKPDYVASVLDLPFEDSSYDVVMAFQVLEHLPFEDFSPALRELKRVCRGHIIVSLPDAKGLWRYSIHIPRVGVKNFFIPRPSFGIKRHVFDGEHYWEINKKGYALTRIMETMRESGLDVLKTYRVPENTWHRFFLLKKR